jgi:hypothetical protein
MSNSNADDEVLGLMQLISESKYSGGAYQSERQLYENFTNELKKAHERGEDISEYVWPPEWNFKKRPKQHHAENIISLADAVDICGKKIYGSLWKDSDWYARSDDEIEKWNPAYNTYLAFSFSEKTQFANFNGDKDSEKQAYKRKSDVFARLSAWLNQGKVNAFNIETDGAKNDITQNTWLSSSAIQILNSGMTSYKEEGAFRANEKYVYLDKIQLMDVLQKEVTECPKDKINLSPEKIVCTDGVWTVEAVLRYSQKNRTGENLKMSEVTKNFIRFLLETPEIYVFVINSFDGKKHPFDRNLLSSKNAVKYILHGIIPINHYSKDDDGDYIFIDKQQFEDYMADLPITPYQETPQIIEDFYIPEYLKLMLTGVQALGLSQDKRADIDIIKDWLDKNWPDGLEGKSDRLIQYMTTLMRRPEDKKGGNRPWKKP